MKTMKSLALNGAFSALLLAATAIAAYADPLPGQQPSSRHQAREATGSTGGGSYAAPQAGQSQASKAQRARAASSRCSKLAYDSPEYKNCMDTEAKTIKKSHPH